MTNYNLRQKREYIKLIRYIQQRRFDRLKQIKMQNMKMKIIAFKVIYLLGSKVLQIYFSGTIAPILMAKLINPINLFDTK